MNSANYKDIMEELQQEYLDSFNDKFALMNNLLVQQDWKSLEMEFHKLKGTGTTYGVPEVSDLCQIVEDLCQKQSFLTKETLEIVITILKKIKRHYQNGEEYAMTQDPFFCELQKM